MDKKELDLLFGKKGKLLCDHFFTLYRRFPKFFPKALLREAAGFISICSNEFIESRDIFVLSKILFSLFRLNQTLTTKKINLKILEITPYVYGITISIFPMSDQEFFKEKHLIKGIKNLIPGIKNVPDSYLYFQKNRRHFFYIEIKKVRGGIFSSAEKKKLQADLHLEFQHRIESLTHSLIVPEMKRRSLRIFCS